METSRWVILRCCSVVSIRAWRQRRLPKILTAFHNFPCLTRIHTILSWCHVKNVRGVKVVSSCTKFIRQVKLAMLTAILVRGAI